MADMQHRAHGELATSAGPLRRRSAADIRRFSMSNLKSTIDSTALDLLTRFETEVYRSR
jgi:hypothetical protein